MGRLTPEQKKTVAEWMGWIFSDTLGWWWRHGGKKAIEIINFSLNDAALCVDELVRQGKYREFWDFIIEYAKSKQFGFYANLFLHLMTMQDGEATNFFTALAEWIEKEK